MSDPITRSGSNYSAPHDANRVPTLLGVLNTDGVTPTPLEINSSGQLLTTSSGGGGGGGTQYQELTTTTPATGTLNLGRYQSSLPTLTTGQMNEPMLDSSSRLLVVDSAAVSSLSTISTNTTGLATASAQSTGNTSLGTIATNTTGVSTAVNQTTMNTNLSSIVTNTGNGATSANQTNGTQLSKITDGTNIANVLSPGVANSTGNAILIAATSDPVTFSVTTVSTTTAVDVGNYSWISIQINTQGTTSTVIWQGSNDNTNWIGFSLLQPISTLSSGSLSTTTSGVVFSGPLNFRYVRLSITGITGGTTAGVILFSTTARQILNINGQVSLNGTSAVSATQTGTWTVQPGNTANTTAWLVTGTGGTFPVTQATAANLNATVVGTGTFAVQAAQSGNWNSRTYDGSGNAITSMNGSLNVSQQASTGTLSQVNSSATSVTVLASNSSRKGATFFNNSTAILYLAFGSTAATTAFTVPLSASAFFEMPSGYTGVVSGIWATANGNVQVTEIT